MCGAWLLSGWVGDGADCCVLSCAPPAASTLTHHTHTHTRTHAHTHTRTHTHTHTHARTPHARHAKRCRYKSPGEAYVEGDASSASYFLAGATITGGTITVEGCGSDSLQVRCCAAARLLQGLTTPAAAAAAC
jgi:5-enolpyruvylshikimate-3-phosphate synthase